MRQDSGPSTWQRKVAAEVGSAVPQRSKAAKHSAAWTWVQGLGLASDLRKGRMAALRFGFSSCKMGVYNSTFLKQPL